MTFEEEVTMLLEAHGIEPDERYLWDRRGAAAARFAGCSWVGVWVPGVPFVPHSTRDFRPKPAPRARPSKGAQEKQSLPNDRSFPENRESAENIRQLSSIPKHFVREADYGVKPGVK